MSTPTAGPVSISHFSDLLCVWAYVAQVRVDELRHHFHEQVAIRIRFCSVFADVGTKVIGGWKDRGGVPAYRAHVEQTIAHFDHVTLHPDAWTRVVPTTSSTAHAVVKAAQLMVAAGTVSSPSPAAADELAWDLRLAFFRDGRDISRLDVQLAVAAARGFAPEALRAHLEDGSAWAAVLRDYEDAAADHVRGSPTYLLNDRRQTLYGNVGYKIIEANVLELLRDPRDQASWC